MKGKRGKRLGTAILALAVFGPSIAAIRFLPLSEWLAFSPSAAHDTSHESLKSDTTTFPFSSDKLVGIAKGLDPHAKGCSNQTVNLHDPNAYGFETNSWTITSKGGGEFSAKFDSDQDDGEWRVFGYSSAAKIDVVFKGNKVGTGHLDLEKRENLPYAIGWQIARDCVVQVELACPYVLGPVDQKSTLRDAPHLARECKLLEMPVEKTIVDSKS